MSGAAALLADTSPLNDEQRSLLELLDAGVEHVIVIIGTFRCSDARGVFVLLTWLSLTLCDRRYLASQRAAEWKFPGGARAAAAEPRRA
jgi:hypothetical protein